MKRNSLSLLEQLLSLTEPMINEPLCPPAHRRQWQEISAACADIRTDHDRPITNPKGTELMEYDVSVIGFDPDNQLIRAGGIYHATSSTHAIEQLIDDPAPIDAIISLTCIPCV